MNSSFFTCDRATHLRIVAVALLASLLMIGIGISGHISDTRGITANAKADGTVVKADRPTRYSTRDESAIR